MFTFWLSSADLPSISRIFRKIESFFKKYQVLLAAYETFFSHFQTQFVKVYSSCCGPHNNVFILDQFSFKTRLKAIGSAEEGGVLLVFIPVSIFLESYELGVWRVIAIKVAITVVVAK